MENKTSPTFIVVDDPRAEITPEEKQAVCEWYKTTVEYRSQSVIEVVLAPDKPKAQQVKHQTQND